AGPAGLAGGGGNREHGGGAVVAVPMRASGAAVGVLLLDLGRRPRLSDGESRLAAAASTHLARIVADARATEEAALRLRVATAVSALLEDGTRAASPAAAVEVTARVARAALGTDAAVGLTIDEGTRGSRVSGAGVAPAVLERLEQRLVGIPVLELPEWSGLEVASGHVVCGSGEGASLVAGIVGLASWAALGLRVRGQLAAVVVCGRRGDPRHWQQTEERLLAHIAMEGSLVLAHAELRQSEGRRMADMAYRAMHDPLTGLANRELFLDRLEHALAGTDRHPGRVAVLFVDLDRFKAVNDTLGHGAGDELLVQAAARLTAALRPEDTVARLAGDELTVLVERLEGPEDALETASRVVDRLGEPYSLAGRLVQVTASVGVALSDASSTAADLLRQADLAMYRAKDGGRDRWQLFEAGLEAPERERLQVEAELHQALEAGELRLWLQPVLPLAGMGPPESWEALVRWAHPTRGLLAAADFVPLAQQGALARRVDWWVLEHAVALLADWHGRWPERVPPVAVNVSPRLVADQHLVERLEDLLRRAAVPPQALALELTEESLGRAGPEARELFERLERAGVGLYLDHVGTGSTPLALLAQHPPRRLKMDMRFVAMAAEPAGSAVLRAGLGLARAFGRELSAVGVETEQQRRALIDLGYGLGQGRRLVPPLPETEATELLARWLGRGDNRPAPPEPARR
ncbi:MAG: putative bifunctional diguanylate cyclase/phosphodiesterase, partial [Acidimicrobiales bacterium]